MCFKSFIAFGNQKCLDNLLACSVNQLTIEKIDDLTADLRTFYYFKISRNKIPFEFPSDGVSVRNFP